uniref:Uncharacterized protein n=1 Tax=Chenopodium quinoa TaxID=63459 RepID=A0A803L8Q3_CHEQI
MVDETQQSPQSVVHKRRKSKPNKRPGIKRMKSGPGMGPNRGDDSDEEHEVRTGITRFSEGCNAFRLAFLSIIKKHTDDEALGPVLSAHKKLVVAKLAEEVTERKVKGEAKKEKQLIEEKGHVKPANFLDSHEKVLIGVATKGALTKRRKEAFMKELSKASAQSADATTKVEFLNLFLSVC